MTTDHAHVHTFHGSPAGTTVVEGKSLKGPRGWRWVPLPALVLSTTLAVAAPDGVLHHALDVQLQPERGRLIATDRIAWPDAIRPRQLELLLNDGLRLTAGSAGVVTRLGRDALHRRAYRVVLVDPDSKGLTLHWEGTPEAPPARPGQFMPGAVLDGDGVYLDGAAAWYPQFGTSPFTADMTVHHPTGWQSVSQGERIPGDDPTTTRWRIAEPQEELYLLAGSYHFYAKPGSHGTAQAFLHSADPQLAQRYLDVTDQYLDLYSRLIGPYPYPKFAVVENRWETGFGMPSFTLLGPRVMRLPFILASSYPHEILHNWWGNSVYPDYASGNWSEGLTSYLADHLLQEQRGQGARYRQAALQKYADYVVAERDFPLREFRSRHDGASQAVGYGKTMMLFHMLRRRIGDADFRAGLRRLYRDYRYQVAGFDDLQREFEAASGQELAVFFAQWIERSGAPTVAIDGAEVSGSPQSGFRLRVRLRQTQAGAPYDLRVPVAVTLQGREQAWMGQIPLRAVQGEHELTLPARPLRLDVDPEFDLFRRLAPEELPPSLGQLFGASRLTVVLPSRVEPRERQAYRELVRTWQRQFPQLRTQDDDQPLPADGGVWVMGESNRHAAQLLKAMGDRYQTLEDGSVRIGTETVAGEGLSLVLTQRRSATSTLAYLHGASMAAIPALARKLPHYGKYSYLAFTGEAAANVAKGYWPVDDSPLVVQLVQERHPRAELPAEIALIR